MEYRYGRRRVAELAVLLRDDRPKASPKRAMRCRQAEAKPERAAKLISLAHGGEARTRWGPQGRDGLGRHWRGGGTAGLVARFAGWDPGRHLYRGFVREAGRRRGAVGWGYLRAPGWGHRRALVRARVHYRRALRGTGDRGRQVGGDALRVARLEDFTRRGVGLLPREPRPLGGDRDHVAGSSVHGRGSVVEAALEGGVVFPSVLACPGRRFRRVITEDEASVVGTFYAGLIEAPILLVLADRGLQRAETEGRAPRTRGDDLAAELFNHLVVVHLEDLIHGQVAAVDLLQNHAARRHADGAALAHVGGVLYVMLVVGALEVHRDYVPTAGIAPRHRHVGVLQRPPMPRLLIVIQQYLYL